MFVPLRQEYVLTRNQMARQIRKKSGTGVYHVMLRGINRKDIFEDGLSTDIIQSLEKTRRNVVLRSELSFGAGIRQLSRLTGISFGVIQKLKNDQERSALPLSLSVATERTPLIRKSQKLSLFSFSCLLFADFFVPLQRFFEFFNDEKV